MKKINEILLLIFILIIIFIVYKSVYLCKDNFAFGEKDMGEYDANLDGRMSFPYINDPTYDQTIIRNYYLNDDTKVNDARLVKHKYQIKSGTYYGSTTPTLATQTTPPISPDLLSLLITSLFKF
jgi:hypothetical protein